MASPYASGGSSSGSVYATPGTSAGSAYAGSTGTSAAPSHHSGLFGAIGHVVAKTAKGLVSDVVHTPGGLLQVAKIPAEEAKATGQILTGNFKGASKTTEAAHKQSTAIVKSTIASTKESFEHPLRHPDQTLLNAFTVATGGASLAGKVADIGSALKEGDIAGAAKAAVTKPKPVTRVISHDGVSVKLPAATNPLTRTVQKATDRLRESFPNVPVVGAAAKVGKAVARETRYQSKVAEVPIRTMETKARQAGMLSRMGKAGPLTKDALARQHAVRVVAEGVTAEDRAAWHQAQLDSRVGSKAQNPAMRAMRDKTFVKGHQEQIDLNQAAGKYLKNVDGKPELTDPKLQDAYDAMKTVAANREELLGRMDRLAAETGKGRLSKPGQILTGNEDFAGGEMRVPTVPAYKGAKSTRIAVGSSQGIGEVKAPGSLTHAYTGAALRGGKIRNDVVKLMSESGLEAQKYWTLLHVTDKLKAAAKEDVPETKHDIPIVTENLPGRPSLAEATARLADENSSEGALATLSHGYEGLRQALFPGYTRDSEGLARPVDESVPGVKFIDERLLGGLNKPNPLLALNQYAAGRGALSTIDAINNASKLAILYLKPAYVAPNLLSNVAMNLVQQGFAAPVNLTRAAKLWAHADPETVNSVLASMGEGKISVLDSNAGVASRVTHKAAGFWQKPVDVLPRLASFLYEARRDGVTTNTGLKTLFKDPAQADKLNQITLRANDAMIDFGDLTPIERSVISRVIFFYPWVKGSAKWLGRYPVDHPIQAGAMGQLGPLGAKTQQDALGDQIPAWAAALIPTGQKGAHGLPNTFDPFTVTPWVQTGNLLQSLGAIGSGHPSEAASGIADMLSPAAGFAATAAGQGIPAAAKGLYSDIPLLTQIEQARGQESKTYPYEGTAAQALLRYLIGTGMVPRETSPAELQKSAYTAAHPRKG